MQDGFESRKEKHQAIGIELQWGNHAACYMRSIQWIDHLHSQRHDVFSRPTKLNFISIFFYKERVCVCVYLEILSLPSTFLWCCFFKSNKKKREREHLFSLCGFWHFVFCCCFLLFLYFFCCWFFCFVFFYAKGSGREHEDVWGSRAGRPWKVAFCT